MQASWQLNSEQLLHEVTRDNKVQVCLLPLGARHIDLKSLPEFSNVDSPQIPFNNLFYNFIPQTSFITLWK